MSKDITINPGWDKPPGPVHRGGLFTLVEQFYYQAPGRDPVAYSAAHSRPVESDDEPYKRTLTAPTEWTALDLGWLRGKPVGVLRIANELAPRGTRPTRDEAAADRARDVFLGVRLSGEEVVPFAVVSPGESCRLQPLDPEHYVIRAVMPDTKITVTAVPE